MKVSPVLLAPIYLTVIKSYDKMANLITMTVQLIIKHLIVQNCERMSYHTHTAFIMYKKV